MDGGLLNMTNSQLLNNRATNYDGGAIRIAYEGSSYGDGIPIPSSTRAYMNGCTLSGNRAQSKGGAVHIDSVLNDTILEVRGCTLSLNRAVVDGGAAAQRGGRPAPRR